MKYLNSIRKPLWTGNGAELIMWIPKFDGGIEYFHELNLPTKLDHSPAYWISLNNSNSICENFAFKVVYIVKLGLKVITYQASDEKGKKSWLSYSQQFFHNYHPR